MKKDVDIRVEIDLSFEGTEVLIKAGERTPLVEDIIHAIDQCAGELYPRIMVYQGDTRKMLRQQEILRVYTENRKLIVRTDEDLFEARSTLREIEKVLESRSFVRISRFEIVNMGRSISFDYSLSGTIKITFDDGSFTYVARRYVHEIEQKLTEWQK